METWQLNISLIPSMAVILSSSNRMVLGITDEINQRLSLNPDAYREIIPLKVQQIKRLSRGIVILNISLMLLVVNALLSGYGVLSPKNDKVLIFIAITLFGIAIYFNVLYAIHAYSIRQRQFKKFLDPKQ